MPELPEVETIRSQLEPVLTGRRIEAAEILDPRWTEPVPPGDVEQSVAGRRIEAIERRGKWLLMRLEGARTLIMHLRMTGNLLAGPADERYLRARFRLDDGSELSFTDQRRFGTGALVEDADLEAFFAIRAGIEPLTEELSADAILQLASGRTAPLKSFLLSQSGIAGIGNIYADEALWRAELHPLSSTGSMKPNQAEALRAGIVGALEAGLANGGASIDDYLDARGEKGSMQDEFLVHRREGKPCPRCETEIRRIVIGGRSSYFCPGCQKRLRRRPRRRAAKR
jgi:formamidopyrimidine-DNA glycosylase